MKRTINLALILLGAIVCLLSCQKAPELTVSSPTSIDLSVDGSSGSITFTANRDWRVTSSDSWVIVSPSSGEASDKPVTVSVRCDANTTYDDRTTTVTILMEDLSQTVTVRQPANLGVVLSKQVFDLQSDTKTIEVEVQSNVQYTVTTSVDWIKQAGTKGLTSKTLSFNIEENKTYDPREGKITIKPQEGNAQEQVISVKQAQKDALIVEKTSYDMPYGGGEIEIKVESNVSFDVTPNADWIHHVQTKALSTSTVLLKIDENATYAAREGKVDIKQQNGSLKHTVTVNQTGRVAVTSIELDKTSLSLRPEETATLIATVKPDNATDKTITWSSSDPAIASVDETGLVVAITDGSTTIAAKAGEQVANCLVEVKSYVANPVDLGVVLMRKNGSVYGLSWADCNLGAFAPEEYGEYYAWGETEVKSDYSWETYKWGRGDTHLSKYCPENQSDRWDPSGGPDGKTELDLEDDAAHLKLGGEWRMPSIEEVQEIENQCDWKWLSRDGVNGYEVKSKINSNSIFLPAAGGRDYTELYMAGTQGNYWTSSLNQNNPGRAYSLDLYSDHAGWGGYYARSVGLPIRPVIETPITIASINLNKNSLGLVEGETEKLTVTITPEYPVDKIVSWTSSDKSIATVDKTGMVTAVKEGSATITAIAGEMSITCSVMVYTVPDGSVDLGIVMTREDGSTYRLFWAECNLGASVPEECGDYYAWGETEVKSYYWTDNYKWCGEDAMHITKYCPPFAKNCWAGEGSPDNKMDLDLEDDAARKVLGGNWRMPTTEEQQALITQCTWTKVVRNGHNGFEVKSKVEGNSNSIFLPTTGVKTDPEPSMPGKVGYYWSSSGSRSYAGYALALYFDYDYDAVINDRQRENGQAIRAVIAL